MYDKIHLESSVKVCAKNLTYRGLIGFGEDGPRELIRHWTLKIVVCYIRERHILNGKSHVLELSPPSSRIWKPPWWSMLSYGAIWRLPLSRSWRTQFEKVTLSIPNITLPYIADDYFKCPLPTRLFRWAHRRKHWRSCHLWIGANVSIVSSPAVSTIFLYRQQKISKKRGVGENYYSSHFLSRKAKSYYSRWLLSHLTYTTLTIPTTTYALLNLPPSKKLSP